MNREQLITRIKSVIYQNDNNEIDAQKHQDLEIEIVNALLDAVANIAGGFLGTLRADAPAPTPQKNGYYIYSTAGNVSYIGGTPTVKIGDWLSVTYVGLNHNYINVDKILNLSNDYTVSNENVGASLKALYDGLSNLSRTIKGDTTSAIASVEDNLDRAIERIDNVDTAIKNIGRLCTITTGSASNARSRVLSGFRRKGFQLERFDTLSNHITEKYIGDTFEDSEWIKESNWLAYANANDIKRVDNEILKIGRLSTSESYTQANARLSVPLANRKRNFELSYNNLDLGDTPRIEQYTGTLFTDIEWVKDSNWITLETKNNKNAANGYAGLDANKRLANELINTNFRKGFGYIFDGVDDYLSVQHNDKLNFGTDDFTLQINCVLSPSTRDECIVQKFANSAPFIGFSLVKGADNSLRIRLGGTTTSTITFTSTITKVNTPISLFCVRSAGTLKTYVNGVLIASSVETSIESINNNETLYISQPTNDKLTGKISLFRLFNRALSQADVTYYENNGRPDLQRLQYSDVITDYGEILRNGTFDNFSVWSRTDASILFEDGKVKFVNSPNLSFISQAAVRIGKQYRCKYTIDSISQGGIRLEVGNRTSPNARTVAGTYVEELKTLNNISFAIRDVGITTATIDNASVVQVGCVLELLPENALPSQWLDSANSLNAIASGNPAINTETPVTDYAIVDNITNNIAVGTANRDYTLPAGYIVDSVCVNSTVALTALQLVNVTTTETLLTGKTASASANKHLPITADQSSSKVDSTIRLNCVGNTGLGFNIVINIKKCL